MSELEPRLKYEDFARTAPAAHAALVALGKAVSTRVLKRN